MIKPLLLSGLLASALVLVMPLARAEQTPQEKLCADYERKQTMLERRLRLGTHGWERPRIQKQLDKVKADRAAQCKNVQPVASAASGRKP